jgi:hypothetical protein
MLGGYTPEDSRGPDPVVENYLYYCTKPVYAQVTLFLEEEKRSILENFIETYKNNIERNCFF